MDNLSYNWSYNHAEINVPKEDELNPYYSTNYINLIPIPPINLEINYEQIQPLYTNLNSISLNSWIPIQSPPINDSNILSRTSHIYSISQSKRLNENPIPKKNQCKICIKSFDRPSSLKIHQISHDSTNAQLYNCIDCKTEFCIKSNYKRHLKSNTHEKAIKAKNIKKVPKNNEKKE